MTWAAIIGIILEIAGFILIIKSTKKLDFVPGDYVAGEYQDPKTKQPPPHIESYPNPLLYRPGIYLIIAGLGLQIVDIAIPEIFNIEEI